MDTVPARSDLEGQAAGDGDSDEEMPQMSVWMTIILLVVVTVVSSRLIIITHHIQTTLLQLVAVTAEWLVDSIGGLTASGNISREFVGIILLPIVGNAAGTRSDVSQVERRLKKTFRACYSCLRFRQGQAYIEPWGCSWL